LAGGTCYKTIKTADWKKINGRAGNWVRNIAVPKRNQNLARSMLAVASDFIAELERAVRSGSIAALSLLATVAAGARL
jgi:hypothetical protein